MRSPDHPPWVSWLRAAPWLAAVVIGLAPRLLADAPSVRPATIGLFAVAVAARLVVAARATAPARRTPVLVMGLGLGLFVAGSLVLALDPGLPFPSPVELVFGGAYLCFVWFLTLDANGGRGRDVRSMLETGVVAGGIISGAVFALLVPAASGLGLHGGPLLIAMAYPIADVVLLATMLTQLLTGRRLPDRRTLLLLGGLVVLAAVDISLPFGVGDDGYAFGSGQALLWAMSLAALAEASTLPPAANVGPVGIGPIVPVGAGLCALLLLTVGARSGPVGVTQVPAALTIVLLLVLLLRSLDEARRGVEAQRLSLTDDLTGIGNRRAVMEELTSSAGQPLSLVLIDLNSFKVVNDTLGHQQGDQVLASVATRLQEVVGDANVVARLGGDEFAIVYRHTGVAEVTRRVEAVLAAMRRPVAVAGLQLTVSLSIGISEDEHGRTKGLELLRRADVAMYRAKETGGGYQWYDEAADTFSTASLRLASDLRTGIAEGQLRAHYQPQVRAEDGEFVAVEALVRWQHPTRGVLAPLDFLPQARKAGLMLPLSLEMIALTLTQAAGWAAAGTPMRLALNVDPPELLSGQWVPALLAAVDHHHLDPALVTVELTEEALITDFTRAEESITELARHGIGVSIDDFGTGYSGLSWLQALPVTELKLDRGFVSRVRSDVRTRHIVESTIMLANQLDIRVVAEGVEDGPTADILAAMGAHLLQGFGIGRPMSPESLSLWWTHRTAVQPSPGGGPGRR